MPSPSRAAWGSPRPINSRPETTRRKPVHLPPRLRVSRPRRLHFRSSPTPSHWVGQRVITKLGTVLNDAPQVGDDPKPEATSTDGERHVLRVYKVEEASGPWLWLVPEKKSVSGWVRLAQVVPYDRAIDYFTSVIRTDPKSGLAYRCRGTLWRWKTEYDKAIADFNEAIRLDPKDAWAYSERGRLASEGGARQGHRRLQPRPSGSIPRTPGRTPSGAVPGKRRGSTTRPSPTTTRPSSSIPRTPRPTSTGATSGGDRVSTTRPSPISPRSIRLDPKDAGAYINRGNRLACQGGRRPGHRRLR